jgi:hypothetical protein
MASHLADATRRAMRSSYGIWLRFLSAKHPDRLTRSPPERIDREIIAEYVAWRRRTCGAVALASDLNRLRLAITYLCPGADLSWLKSIAKRLANQAAPKPGRAHQVTSEQLYALGLKLMDEADRKRRHRKTRGISVPRWSAHCASCPHSDAPTNRDGPAHRPTPPEIR